LSANIGLNLVYAMVSSAAYLLISFLIYKKSVRKARETGALLWF
jgi:hypothetical protein